MTRPVSQMFRLSLLDGKGAFAVRIAISAFRVLGKVPTGRRLECQLRRRHVVAGIVIQNQRAGIQPRSSISESSVGVWRTICFEIPARLQKHRARAVGLRVGQQLAIQIARGETGMRFAHGREFVGRLELAEYLAALQQCQLRIRIRHCRVQRREGLRQVVARRFLRLYEIIQRRNPCPGGADFSARFVQEKCERVRTRVEQVRIGEGELAQLQRRRDKQIVILRDGCRGLAQRFERIRDGSALRSICHRGGVLRHLV
jgi:hypothetical protein